MPRRSRSASIARSAPSRCAPHIDETRPRRRHAGLRLSQCRPAQRDRPTTTRARQCMAGLLERVRRRRPRQHRRRLLRHHARPHPRHRRAPSPARRRAQIPERAAARCASPASKPFTLYAGQSRIRQCRRADQRHRLGALSQADQGQRLRRRARSRAPAGRERRQMLDVNMDEGMLDSEKAMVTFLNLHRRRA